MHASTPAELPGGSLSIQHRRAGYFFFARGCVPPRFSSRAGAWKTPRFFLLARSPLAFWHSKFDPLPRPPYSITSSIVLPSAVCYDAAAAVAAVAATLLCDSHGRWFCVYACALLYMCGWGVCCHRHTKRSRRRVEFFFAKAPAQVFGAHSSSKISTVAQACTCHWNACVSPFQLATHLGYQVSGKPHSEEEACIILLIVKWLIILV